MRVKITTDLHYHAYRHISLFDCQRPDFRCLGQHSTNRQLPEQRSRKSRIAYSMDIRAFKLKPISCIRLPMSRAPTSVATTGPSALPLKPSLSAPVPNLASRPPQVSLILVYVSHHITRQASKSGVLILPPGLECLHGSCLKRRCLHL